jgi:hypothetical protein
MAMPKRIRVEFGEVFPFGVYAVSEVSQVRDFDRSTKDKPVYATDEDSGLSVWSVDVMDGDPEARKADRQLSVKLLAKVQPVLPDTIAGLPFRPVEFEGLTATPYVAETGNGRARLAWSFRATGVRAPKNAPVAKSA